LFTAIAITLIFAGGTALLGAYARWRSALASSRRSDWLAVGLNVGMGGWCFVAAWWLLMR
jgi:hypothetical protein